MSAVRSVGVRGPVGRCMRPIGKLRDSSMLQMRVKREGEIRHKTKKKG
jgi:hypothetical protein